MHLLHEHLEPVVEHGGARRRGRDRGMEQPWVNYRGAASSPVARMDEYSAILRNLCAARAWPMAVLAQRRPRIHGGGMMKRMVRQRVLRLRRCSSPAARLGAAERHADAALGRADQRRARGYGRRRLHVPGERAGAADPANDVAVIDFTGGDELTPTERRSVGTASVVTSATGRRFKGRSTTSAALPAADHDSTPGGGDRDYLVERGRAHLPGAPGNVAVDDRARPAQRRRRPATGGDHGAGEPALDRHRHHGEEGPARPLQRRAARSS